MVPEGAVTLPEYGFDAETFSIAPVNEVPYAKDWPERLLMLGVALLTVSWTGVVLYVKFPKVSHAQSPNTLKTPTYFGVATNVLVMLDPEAFSFVDEKLEKKKSVVSFG